METTLATLQSADVENAIPSKKNNFYATAWYKQLQKRHSPQWNIRELYVTQLQSLY